MRAWPSTPPTLMARRRPPAVARQHAWVTKELLTVQARPLQPPTLMARRRPLAGARQQP